MQEINHGKAKLVQPLTLGDITYNNVVGTITAWLPEDDIYAILFDEIPEPNNWVRFDKQSFDTFCELIELYEQ